MIEEKCGRKNLIRLYMLDEIKDESLCQTSFAVVYVR